MQNKKECMTIIKLGSAASAICSLNIIPGVDTALITMVQTIMIMMLGNKLGMNISASYALSRAGINIANNIGKYLMNETAGMVPVVGTAANVFLSYYITHKLGEELLREYSHQVY